LLFAPWYHILAEPQIMQKKSSTDFTGFHRWDENKPQKAQKPAENTEVPLSLGVNAIREHP